MRQFVKEREWEKWHTPKNVAAALSVEASELLELFMWDVNQGLDAASNKREQIQDELADVLCYLVRLSDLLQIDLNMACKQKMAKNKEKYPISKFKGNFKKYNEIT